MDYEAVKKKWDSWISKNLASLQEVLGIKGSYTLTLIIMVFVWKKMDQYNRK